MKLNLNVILFGSMMVLTIPAFSAPLPKLDLRKLPKNQAYNLYENGCAGVRLAIPTNHRVVAKVQGEAKCELSDLPKLLDEGYQLDLNTEIGEDAGECIVELINSTNSKKVRSYSFSCNPT